MITDHAPSVYFIVTGRQNGSWLSHCFESLLQQTSADWHCIYVDDASTDQSVSVAENYQNNYPGHFTLLKNQQRLLKTVSFNKACKLIPSTAVVAEMDADDRLLGNEVVSDLIILHTFFDVVWTQHITKNLTNLPWDTWRSTEIPSNWSRKSAAGNNVWSKEYFPGHMRTFKKLLFDYIDPKFFIFQNEPLKVSFDMVYYTSLLELVPPDFICFYSKNCYEYRVLPHNDEFLERSLRNSKPTETNSKYFQTAMDAWFKTQPTLTKMKYTKDMHIDRNNEIRVNFHGNELPASIYHLNTSQAKQMDKILINSHVASGVFWWQ